MRHVLLLAMLWLTACSGETLEALRAATPTGTPFQQALAKYYLDFADQEASRFDWWSSQHFAAKGLAAAYGDAVQPERMEYWNLEIEDAREREALGQARAWLVVHLDRPGANPDDLARAQVYFDCWIEESTELGESKAKHHCREEMENLLMKLGPVSGSARRAVPSEPLQAEEVNVTYLVLFDLGSAELNADAMDVIEIIRTDLHNIDEYEIVLNGHADGSGRQEANMELSLKRAKRVEKALVDSGFPAELISLYAFGETDPKEAAAGEKDRKANRRVEVVIN